jgi:hypothetical protein
VLKLREWGGRGKTKGVDEDLQTTKRNEDDERSVLNFEMGSIFVCEYAEGR